MEKKLKGHLISKVDPGSIGEELELEPGDCVLTINGNPIEDIFDYEYYVNSPSMLMTVRKADGEEWELSLIHILVPGPYDKGQTGNERGYEAH